MIDNKPVNAINDTIAVINVMCVMTVAIVPIVKPVSCFAPIRVYAHPIVSH